MAREHGFTLIEVLVALTIGGLALASAGLLVVATADGADRIEQFGAATDRTVLPAHALRLLAGSAVVNPTFGFHGTESEARFRARRTVPTGVEAIDVRLVCTGDRLQLVLSYADAVTVVSDLERCAIGYRAGYGDGAPWVTAWASRTDAPLALRVQYGRAAWTDTLTIVFGERG